MRPKLVFYKDHNLLIYPKTAMIKLKISSKITIKKIDSSNSSKSFNFDNDLFNVEDI